MFFENYVGDSFLSRLILSALILLASVISAGFVRIILENYAKRLTAKTKTRMDDAIIEKAKKPLYFSIILIGFIIAGNLIFVEYSQTINLIGKSLLIFIAFFFLSRIAGILLIESFVRIGKRRELLDEKTVEYFSRIIKYAILAVGIILILDNIGIEITPLLASAGLLSLAVAFASQEALSNVISGVFIAASKPFKIGDAIMIQNEYGNIERMTLRHTVIKLWDNRRMIIPNSVLNKEVIINYSLDDPKMLTRVEVGISYESDIGKAMRIMTEAARKHSEFLPEMEPKVQVLSFGDSSVNLRLLSKAKDQPTAFSMACDLRKTIKEEFDRQGIEIPYPRRVIIERKK